MKLYPGKCDICTKPDGIRDHNLQKCSICSVLVHELCHGMPPTTTKDVNFVCHACNAIGKEIEVNVPSKVGGWSLKDVLVQKEGVDSLKDFLNGEDRKRSVGDAKRVCFYAAISEFQATATTATKSKSADAEVEDDMFGDGIKSQAQQLFDTFCARDAEQRVQLPGNVLNRIDSTIFNSNYADDGNNEEVKISPKLFDEAKQSTYQSLEKSNLMGRYKQSTQYKAYIATQRVAIKQEERPTECVLCSVRTGTHAMHPLYDMHGKEGRQVLIPASGVGFKHKPSRLAWVHTLCAMFISSSPMHGGLVYGCMEDGSYEEPEEEEESDDDDQGGRKNDKKTIVESSDEEDEVNDMPSEEAEQRNFTKCEMVFQPLLEKTNKASSDSNESKEDTGAAEVLECINSMIKNVELITPSFLNAYPVGPTVKTVKKSFERTHPEVKARCKLLTSEMKRVYRTKENNVPDGFQPVKNLRWIDVDQNKRQRSSNSKSADEHIVSNDEKQSAANKVSEDDDPLYEIGTTLSKKFHNKWYDGTVTSYDSSCNPPLYHVEYEDGDSEDLNETEVSQLLCLTHTKWFCISPSDINGEETVEGSMLKDFRGLGCVICSKKDTSKHCLRIPVQCIASDRSEFKEFKRFHKDLNKKIMPAKARGESHDGCTTAMHVGCARWGNDYAKVKNKDIRMCYYFPGKPPTYTGPDDYTDTVSNCFCRVHAIEIQNGLIASSNTKKKRAEDGKGDAAGEEKLDDANNGNESDDSAEKESRLRTAIAKKKKARRIMEESDEESD